MILRSHPRFNSSVGYPGNLRLTWRRRRTYKNCASFPCPSWGNDPSHRHLQPQHCLGALMQRWLQDISRQVSLRHHKKFPLGFIQLLGEAKCFSHLWVVMEIAERKPTQKAPGWGWKRLHRNADTSAHTSMDRRHYLYFVPWQCVLFLSGIQAQLRVKNWLKWPLNDWNSFSASWKSELSWVVQK